MSNLVLPLYVPAMHPDDESELTLDDAYLAVHAAQKTTLGNAIPYLALDAFEPKAANNKQNAVISVSSYARGDHSSCVGHEIAACQYTQFVHSTICWRDDRRG